MCVCLGWKGATPVSRLTFTHTHTPPTGQTHTPLPSDAASADSLFFNAL